MIKIQPSEILLSLKKNWEYPILFFITFIFFNLNNKALFLLDNPNLARNSDAWFNLGFMISPKELFATGPDIYQWDRVTWELPGHILFKFLDPIQAQYFLHFGFFIVAIFSFFLINKHFFNKNVALISSILMLSFSPFLMFMGSNYVDAPIITFFLLSLLMIISISNKNKVSLKLSFAGIFFACMVIVQPISFCIYIVALVGTYYLSTTGWGKKQHILGFISIFCGIIGTLIISSVIYYFLTGSYSFLHGTILFLSKYTSNPNPWYRPWYIWVEPFHYIILVFLILSIVWCLIRIYKMKYPKDALSFPFYFVVSCIFFIFMSIKPNPSPILKNVFVCLLFPLAFFSISSILDRSIKKMGTDCYELLVITELLIICLPYLFQAVIYNFSYTLIHICTQNFYLLLVSVFSLFLLLIFIPYIKKLGNSKTGNFICFTVIILIFVNFTAFNIVAEPTLFIDNPKYQLNSLEEGFSSVVDANKIINSETGGSERKVVWYNETETDHNGNYYGGLFETIGYTTLSYGYNFPEYGLNNITKICSESKKQNCEKTTLFVLSTDPTIFSKIQTEFRQKNQTLLLFKTDNIQNGKVSFNISTIKFFQNNNSGFLNIPKQTSDSLKQIIASEYPEITNQNTTDFEKVNILRDWAYEHTDSTFTLSESLDSDPNFRYYQKNAPEIYSAFLNDQGGVACGGTAYALHQLYEMYGYQSDVVSVGDPSFSNHTSHAVTVVQINNSNKQILVIEDAYFDLTITDENNSPVDFLEVVKLLNNDEYASLNVQYGSKKPVDIIIKKTSDDSSLFSKTSWRVVEDNRSIDISDSLFKIKIQRDLEKYEDSMRVYYTSQNASIKSPYFNSTYPALSLFKNPFSIVHDQNPDTQLMKKVECIIDNNCIYEPLTEADLKQLIPIINLTLGNDFKNRFEINCNSGNCYRKTVTDGLIFMPESDSDHIASKFFGLPMNLTNEQPFVTSITYDSTENLTQTPKIYIQNNDYTIVSDDLNDYIFSNTTNGNLSLVNEFYLPAGDNSVRILIQSPTNQESILPKEIDIYSKKP